MHFKHIDFFQILRGRWHPDLDIPENGRKGVPRIGQMPERSFLRDRQENDMEHLS